MVSIAYRVFNSSKNLSPFPLPVQAPADSPCDISSAHARLLLGAELLQCHLSDSLRSLGYDRKCFSLEDGVQTIRRDDITVQGRGKQKL